MMKKIIEAIGGIKEIANMAGVSSQTVYNWRSRSSDFPPPLKELSNTPLFSMSQVRVWIIHKKTQEDIQEFVKQREFEMRKFKAMPIQEDESND